jgi:hypothetical protein
MRPLVQIDKKNQFFFLYTFILSDSIFQKLYNFYTSSSKQQYKGFDLRLSPYKGIKEIGA